MAKRKRTRKNHKAIALAVVALVVMAAIVVAFMSGGWHKLVHNAGIDFAGGNSPLAVATAHIDAANEGRTVRISGNLEITKAPVDPQLGISAPAALLFRHVEMYQWHEQCDAGDCKYAEAWSAQPQDSRKFHVAAGHLNPAFAFTAARFAAGEIRMGAFTIDPALLAAQAAAVDYPVHVAALPPNLAASFGEVDGVLFAGGDASHPQVGALRIRYSIVPATTNVTLTGVQHASHLTIN